MNEGVLVPNVVAEFTHDPIDKKKYTKQKKMLSFFFLSFKAASEALLC